ALVDEIGLLRMFKEEGTQEAQNRYENIQELLSAIAEFSKRHEAPTLEAFLEEVSLITDIDTWNDKANAVTLMTLHSAKGLEFPVVFIAGLEEGLFPLSRTFNNLEELEEERRLFYVGATRAQEKLYLSWAANRGRFGESYAGIPSRFIKEIGQEFLHWERRIEMEVPVEGTIRPTRRGKRYLSDYKEPAFLEDECQAQPLLEPGVTVRHASFGEGTVLEVEGQGENTKITVLFKTAGKKRLMVKYANLEIL
ncbi:MAG: ATP-binding domain-containing protein, partial [candidate division KSB1 bacterium]|nr:ATP-binding domain-containing protein [candidate division KSB1 bacterium]